jgi:hypothetical protein
MDMDERIALEALRDRPEDMDSDPSDNLWINVDQVVDGSTRLNISHAGGEFREMLEEVIQKENP